MKNKIVYIAILLSPLFLTGCNLGAAWNMGL